MIISKRTSYLGFLIFMCVKGLACLNETSAQEPVQSFEIEDKESEKPDMANDFEAPKHPTIPPPKPVPIIFSPGELPWAPQDYTIYFHLQEEANWTAKYDGKFWSARTTDYLQRNKLSFRILDFLDEYSRRQLFPLNQKSFEGVFLPDGFWEGKSIHFFETNEFDDVYSVEDIFIRGGYVYNFKSSKMTDDYFMKHITCTTIEKCLDIESFHIISKSMSLADVKQATVLNVKTKAYVGTTDGGGIAYEKVLEAIEKQGLDLSWQKYCYSFGLSALDFYADLIGKQIKECRELSVSVVSRAVKPSALYKTTKINP